MDADAGQYCQQVAFSHPHSRRHRSARLGKRDPGINDSQPVVCAREARATRPAAKRNPVAKDPSVTPDLKSATGHAKLRPVWRSQFRTDALGNDVLVT
jgi:hypothetical protein